MVCFQVIFKHPRGVNPLPEGKYLGEMSREYEDYRILEFVAAGAKYFILAFKHASHFQAICYENDSQKDG